MICISLSRAHYIQKNILNVRKISARWMPHLLTDGQKSRVKIFNCSKYFQNKKKIFSIVVTGDVNWVRNFEPVRKASNKIWASKNQRKASNC